MNKKDVYRLWAPFNKKWTDWCKPVSFINMDGNFVIREVVDYTIPKINYINELCKDTAIIIDINGNDSILEGLALSMIGYRPVLVFNGTLSNYNSLSNVNNECIFPLLTWSADVLKNISFNDDSPPVFLLDNNRLNRYRINRTIFDNSYDIYHQDLPSFKYLLDNGIKKIVVRSNRIAEDLGKLLYKYQKNGILILLTNGYDSPSVVKIKKPKKEE